MRICCGNQRGFQIFILDNFQNQVMRISREFKCCAGCCWCAGCCDHCAFELTIEAPVGQVVGYVKQRLLIKFSSLFFYRVLNKKLISSGSFWKASYDILDELHEPVLLTELVTMADRFTIDCNKNIFKFII